MKSWSDQPVWVWLLGISSLCLIVIGIAALRGWPFGVVPDWFEAVGTVGALMVAVRVLQVEQRNRITDQRERQAREVTGHLEWAAGGEPALVLTVTNAGSLPVRDVRGFGYVIGDLETEPLLFPPIPVARPDRETTRTLWVDDKNIKVRLEIEFDDDAGVRWRKLGDPWLEEIQKS